MANMSQPEQQTPEDPAASCARTRPAQMISDTGNLLIDPKRESVQGKISDNSALCAGNSVISGLDSLITKPSERPHPNIFKPAVDKRNPLSHCTGQREKPAESRCLNPTDGQCDSNKDGSKTTTSIPTAHIHPTVSSTNRKDNAYHKQGRSCETESKDKQVASPAVNDDICPPEGFADGACDKTAQNGSDSSCAKVLDFKRDTTRKDSCSSGRSRELRTTIKPATTDDSHNDMPLFKFAGIIVGMSGSLFSCSSSLCIKLFPQNSPYGLQEKLRAVFVRGWIFMILCGASIYMQGSTIKVARDEIWVNVARALLGCCGTVGGYLSLCYISLGDGTALIFASPLWTSILSHFILGEPLSWILLLALPCSMIGIVLIAHPSLLLDLFISSDLAKAPMFAELNATMFNDSALELSFGDMNDVVPSKGLADDSSADNRWIGVCMSLATSLCVSFVYIVLKFRKTTNIQTTTFWLGVATCIEGCIVLCFVGFGDIPSLAEASLLLGNGLLSWLSQICLQWALYYEDASVLSVVRTIEVAMSFILSALMLDDEIYWTSILGAAIIAFVVILMILNKGLGIRRNNETILDGVKVK